MLSNSLHASALLTPADTAEADRRAVLAGVTIETLMRRAGLAVADLLSRQLSVGTRIVVACGPGANGGDGLAAAAILKRRGYRVECGCTLPREALRGAAAVMAGEWPDPVAPIEEMKFEGAGRIIDALFGAGLSRPIDGAAAAAIARIAASGVPVVAVDLPSGYDGETGLATGPAIRASDTVAFERRRPAHWLLPARSACGTVHVAGIGMPEAALTALSISTFENGPALWGAAFPRLKPEGHKYDRGAALVLSGGLEGGGAARLSARGALRIGAGLVTLAVPDEALAMQAAANTAVMVRRADGAEGWRALLADERRNALVMGPAAGVGEVTRARVLDGLAAGRACVLDADALTSFAEAPQDLFAAIAANKQGVVLTPHQGEFAKLFKAEAELLSGRGKLVAAREAARRSGAVVVAKGFDTVIAAPDGLAAINGNATPALGTAGSGDVLSGMVAGLLAQRMPAFEAACAGVYLHAAAGASVGPGLIAEDIPEALPSALRTLATQLDEL